MIRTASISERALATIGDASPLMRYDAACRAVAEAKSIDEVKDFRDKAEAMRAYAKQAKNKQLEIDASEIRFRAERRIGELMAAQRDAGLLSEGGRPKTGLGNNPVSSMRFINEFEDRAPYGPPERAITLTEAGIDKNLADRARKYAAVPEQEFESILADRRERIETENKRVTVNLIEAGVRGTLGTGENEWYTPEEYLYRVRLTMGGIELDPASSEVANRTVKADEFYSEENDGLAKEWAGRVWLNPPYAQPAISYFADKMVEEWESGRIEAAIVLTHNYTDTAWFQKLAHASTAICFTRGRIRFVSPTGELAAPTQGQAFFYFGHELAFFVEQFHDVGFIVEVRR